MSATAQHGHHGAEVSAKDRARYGRRAQLLAGVSVGYNLVEAVIAITAGLVAGRWRWSGSASTRWLRSPPA